MIKRSAIPNLVDAQGAPLPHPRWLTKHWRGFVDMWRTPRKTTNGGIILAGLVMAISGVLTYGGFKAQSWATCSAAQHSRVDSRNALRDVLDHFANGVTLVLPGSSLAAQYAKSQIDYVDEKYPELHYKDLIPTCGDRPWLSFTA